MNPVSLWSWSIRSIFDEAPGRWVTEANEAEDQWWVWVAGADLVDVR